MSLRRQSPAQQPAFPRAGRPCPVVTEAYNIIPVAADHPALEYPQVRAACETLRSIGGLRWPPLAKERLPHHDVLDWLALFFRFQDDNVRNQREHLILHLSNLHMRLSDNPDALDPGVVRSFRKKLLQNYTDWCSYLGKTSNVWISKKWDSVPDLLRHELLYISLWLLIWGESANLRFMPECLSYIFHHMAGELSWILEDYVDQDTGRPVLPAYYGAENDFLGSVVRPIYEAIRREVGSSNDGTASHSSWRNYDDFNEYFWSNRCFKALNWPLDLESEFFFQGAGKRKTGFVERRSFWNVFRSFHRLWVMLILFFQGAIILAWEEEDNTHPWRALSDRNVKIRFFSVLVTWSGVDFFKSMLDTLTQYTLVGRETLLLGMRMLVSNLISSSWAIALGWLYVRIWLKREEDGSWSPEAENREKDFLKVAIPFVLLKLLPFARSFVPESSNFFIKMYRKVYCLLADQSYVGRGLREGMLDYAKYSVFWMIVLSAKFSFSYFLQVQPMIGPTKKLWNLGNVSYRWHDVFTERNVLIIGLLWVPVVLIYLMDIQIWYSICTFLVGVTVALFSRLGVIQNIGQLRHRFDQFAGEVLNKFNFVPEESMPPGAANKTIPQFMKLEPNHATVRKFAMMWNEIITAFREEDVISDDEVKLLVFTPNSWGLEVITWPCFLLQNNLLLALRATQKIPDAPDKLVRRKLFKDEFTRSAVLEAYGSVKHLLTEVIIGHRTEEHSAVVACFQEIEHSLEIGKFTETFNVRKLPRIHDALIGVIESLTKAKRNLEQIVISLQDLNDIFVQEFMRDRRSFPDGLAPRNSPNPLFVNALDLPDPSDITFAQQIHRLQTILTARDSMENVPANEDARRRITFFSNSFFMDMPKAPPVEKMRAFSVLTPYYDEAVIYSQEELKTRNEDGITVLYYLQTVYEDDWKNFIERMRREGMVSESELWSNKLRDLRLWASYRGQTLARTVRGMMYYRRAIKFSSFLESQLGPSEGLDNLIGGHHRDVARLKYMYLVTCQKYGDQKAKNDPRAEAIRYLMRKYESLRVAYVDEVKDRDEYYSVLIRYDQEAHEEVEVYRIKLPGPFKLGEGKPENQNHAIVFTRGDAVQTIDMNQDNYLEEALKMRNLLEEFDTNYGIRKPTILGVRAHIYTASVSSLAWFMSSQETGFVTSGQRVLANPLKVRMHYGHPDVFDRIWFLTRGGVSKASRGINVTEDIFAGFNCTARGGNVTHHEYMQIGKGRDVGLNQISMFEAKIACGSAEQLLSRDVYRLGHKLDFFRMLSFYHSTVGFYFNNNVVIWTMYLLFWGKLYMALSGAEDFQFDLDSHAVRAILEIQLIQLVLLSGLPAIIDGSVECGVFPAIWDFMISQLQLSPVFYTFSMGTRAHFFEQTILHGGAKYRATGREFVVRHESFSSNYRLYAWSHFIKAIELALVLIVYSIFSPLANGTFSFIDTSIAGWFLVISWMFSPFIFNPSGFDWFKTVNDFEDFLNWIWFRYGILTKPEESWEVWWSLEQYYHLRTTDFLGKSLEIILSLRFFFFQFGIVNQLKVASGKSSFAVYLLSWAFFGAAFALHIMISVANRKYAAKRHSYYRLFQLFGIMMSVSGITVLSQFTEFRAHDVFVCLLAVVPTGWGLVSIAQVFRPVLRKTCLWDTVVSTARLYHLLFGVILMAPVAILSWLPGFQSMQTRILFNAAFGRGLQVGQMLSGSTSMPNS